jgi:hypothetical protein
MNKIKNLLLKYFEECTSSNDKIRKVQSEVLYKDILLIIVGYCTPYYESLPITLNINNHSMTSQTSQDRTISVVKTLTNNRIVIGYFDGTTYVLNLTDDNRIIKRIYIIISKICQIDDDIIVCTAKNEHLVYIWNLKDNIIKYLAYENGTNDQIIILEKDLIVFGGHDSTIRTLKLNREQGPLGQSPSCAGGPLGQSPSCAGGPLGQSPSFAGGPLGQSPSFAGGPLGQSPSFACGPREWFSDYITDYMTTLNNKIIVSSSTSTGSKIDIIDKSELIQPKKVFIKRRLQYMDLKDTTATIYKEETKSDELRIIPCFNKFSTKSIVNNNIIIVRTFYMSNSPCNTLLLCNIETKKSMNIIENIQGLISSVIYLNNGYFAMLIDGNIMIYHIPTKLLIQTIRDVNEYVFLEQFNNDGFIAIDKGSNIKIYE